MARFFQECQVLIGTAVLTAGIFALNGCTVKTGSQVGPRITKVNPYRLEPGVSPGTTEEMIDFEYRRKVWGAVDHSDLKGRYGDYFTIFWQADRENQPVTVKLYYRQASSGPKTFVQEKVVANPLRSNSTKFEIVGDEFCNSGGVTQWMASIVREGIVVDEYKSFLWQ